MVDPDIQPLVIDIGSGFTKAGFAGDDSPRNVFPSIVGRPKGPGIMVGMDAKDCFVGEEAEAKRGILKLKYPIEHGMVTNWNDMEKIWHHTFYYELRVTPEEHPVLLTEVPFNPRNNREKMTSIMFETFNVVALYIAKQPALSLFASGRSTGVVIDSGDGVTHTVPIYEGHVMPYAVRRMNLAGRDITEYLVKILSDRGYEMTTSAERRIVRDIKEQLCYVSTDYDPELAQAEETGHCEREYTLPDDSKMTIGDERFRAPEILFRPDMIGSELDGLHLTVCKSIRKCYPELHGELFNNILLSGGSTMFDGLEERLMKDIRELVSSGEEEEEEGEEGGGGGSGSVPVVSGAGVRVVSPTAYRRTLSAWRGGAVMTCLESFSNVWITKEDYDDAGATIVHRKCF